LVGVHTIDATGCFNDSMNAIEKILKAYTINNNGNKI
jgi:hypothetical protein